MVALLQSLSNLLKGYDQGLYADGWTLANASSILRD
jgi:hypothetical protein